MQERGPVAGSSAFGMLLRRFRLAAGLSQEALAERARMSSDGVSALERGHRRTPQRETLALLAGALALDERQREEFEATAARSGLPRRLGAASVTVGPWTDSAIASLPLALTSFIGRDRELVEIAALVHDHRMVTLTGAGGVGKTQTALHVGTALSHAVDGAVVFIGLAPIGNPSLVVATIASMLGVQQVPNRPLLETVLAFLKNNSLLLILDNCEHVITQAAIVANALLAGCPRVRILATSREPLRAAGEHSYRLPSLSIPTPEAANVIRATEATAYGVIVLFTDRAHAVDHRFTVTDENAPIVAEICRRLDGIPLAIELAAARVNQLSVKAIAKKLDDRFRLLTGGGRMALPRQQTMRATIDWSYDLLAPREQRLFERLSIFAGGCTLGAAAAVCRGEEAAEADVFELLSSLLDKSLLVADLEGSETRYRLLESFREYARERLAARGDRDMVAQRHATAYLELATQLDRVFFYEPDEVLQVQAHEELDNWRAALEWTLTNRGEILLGQRLVGELSAFWQNTAPVEGRRWLVCALELVDEQTPPSVVARLSYTEATIAMALAETEVQLASSRRAVARYRVVGDSLGIALAQSREVQALFELGRVAEAKSVLQEALPLARSVGNRWLVAWILRLSGVASLKETDFVAARGYTAEALQYYKAADGKIDVGFTMLQLSGAEFFAGNAELALRHAADALATFRTINHARGVGSALTVMATYLISLARHDEAATSAREALYLAREHHLDVHAADALELLGATAALRLQTGAESSLPAYVRVARILGFCDARLAALGSPRDHVDLDRRDRVLTVLRDRLGADTVAKLMAAGAAMTEEQVVEEASGLS